MKSNNITNVRRDRVNSGVARVQWLALVILSLFSLPFSFLLSFLLSSPSFPYLPSHKIQLEAPAVKAFWYSLKTRMKTFCDNDFGSFCSPYRLRISSTTSCDHFSSDLCWSYGWSWTWRGLEQLSPFTPTPCDDATISEWVREDRVKRTRLWCFPSCSRWVEAPDQELRWGCECTSSAVRGRSLAVRTWRRWSGGVVSSGHWPLRLPSVASVWCAASRRQTGTCQNGTYDLQSNVTTTILDCVLGSPELIVLTSVLALNEVAACIEYQPGTQLPPCRLCNAGRAERWAQTRCNIHRKCFQCFFYKPAS